jgi:SAM-dependent methyltransferase
VIDVGGGDSRLVDHLLERGLTCLTVLDVCGNALARARERLGARSRSVAWIEADVTGTWPVPAVDIWHDRAVFHFLTDGPDRRRYVERLRQALNPGGSAILATFGPEGPRRCSGLPVTRYTPGSLEGELGPPFRLRESIRELHTTPGGAVQEFWYARFTIG